MSELVPEYSRDNFPYAGIFEDLTVLVQEEQLNPVEAYAAFLDTRNSQGLSPYFEYASTSITSGGHAHLIEGIDKVIEANTRTAREMISVLDAQGTLEGRRVVLPVDFGKVDWQQSDYMTFWGLIIAGPDLRGMDDDELDGVKEDLDDALNVSEVNLHAMNDSSLDREDRRIHYADFIDVFAGAVSSASARRCLPAYRVVSLIDPGVSLGCWAETRLAKRLDIPRKRIAPVKLSTIEEAIPFRSLQDDLRVMTAAGASSVVALKGSILALVNEDMP